MIILRASIIGLLFAVLLSVANHLTAPEIINNKQAFSERKIAEMVDGRVDFQDLLQDAHLVIQHVEVWDDQSRWDRCGRARQHVPPKVASEFCFCGG